MTASVRIGDLLIEQDPAPPAVLAALRRLEAAMRRGDPPGSGTTAHDGAVLRAWLEEQDRNHPPEGAA